MIVWALVIVAVVALNAWTVLAAPPKGQFDGPPVAGVLLSELPINGMTRVEDLPGDMPPGDYSGAPDGVTCESGRRRWDGADGLHLIVSVIHCDSARWMAHLQGQLLDDTRVVAGEVDVMPDVPGATVVTLLDPDNAADLPVPFVQVALRRGLYLVQATAVLSDGGTVEAAVSMLGDVAAAQAAMTPGPAGAAAHLPGFRELVPEMALLVALLLAGIYGGTAIVGRLKWTLRGLVATSREPTNTATVNWTTVEARATYLERASGLRFVLVVAIYAAMAWYTITTDLSTMTLFVGAVLGTIAVVLASLGRRHTPGAREIWDEYARSQERIDVRRGRALVWYMGASALLVLSAASLIPPAALIAYSRTDYVGDNGRWSADVIADAGASWHMIPPALVAADLVVFSMGLLWLSSSAYRMARRSASIDAAAMAHSATQRPVLYLRNFSDDDLTIRTSRLTRYSQIEKLGIRQFERFEEIVVRYLSVFGPVMAINNPARRPMVGAARWSLPDTGDEAWQGKVRELIGQSQLIVVAAAPETESDGLRWEIGEIVAQGALGRTVFVIPPYPADELHSRWKNFERMAAALDLPLVEEHLDRLIALKREGPTAWRAYHAARRTDWSYALAFSEAAEKTAFAPTTSQVRSDQFYIEVFKK